jgi:signal transduction histidine kinase
VARCLESIPREIGRLDRSIDLVLRSSDDDRRSRFDVGLTAERLVSIVEARARRQHVTTSLELTGGSREISGFEDRLGGAVLNLLVNALDAMPDEGRLGVTVHGGPLVRITICDSGPGLAAGEDDSVHAPDGDGIGLLVARSVVEAHQGRMSCRANPPRGTCVELDLPVGAATAEDEAWRMR